MAKSVATTELIAEAQQLAQLGYNDVNIYKALGISNTSFYKHSSFVDAVTYGRELLRKTIASQVIKSSKTESQDRLFLAKQLNLFQPSFKIKNHPKTPKDAQDYLASAMVAYADGLLSESRYNAVVAGARVFAQVYEISELTARIERLEGKVIESA